LGKRGIGVAGKRVTGKHKAARHLALADRIAIWRAGRLRSATGFARPSVPRSIGLYTRGQQIVEGHLLMAGHLAEAPGQLLWDVPAPDPAFAAETQGFQWLDDLAALGDAPAMRLAQGWTADWIARFGRGRGPGWTPGLTGRRLIRWMHHGTLLLHRRPGAEAAAFYRSATRQAAYLARRWQAAPPGLPRFEALTGLLTASLTLTGLEPLCDPALAALARDCGAEIDAEGGIQSRNPEELLEVFTLLTWAAEGLAEAEHSAPPELGAAIDRIALALRALRHADGGVARFHSGGRGIEGRLDHALAQSNTRPGSAPGQAMGFARLGARRTTVIIDATAPPSGRAAGTAHASTTAFELTSGRRPVIVNCGAGAPFGAEWGRASRATASHSALSVEGYSSSRLGEAKDGIEPLSYRCGVTARRQTTGPDGTHLHLTHDGWSSSHGLTTSRGLVLSNDGRILSGEDALLCVSSPERRLFESVMTRTGNEGVRFALRFHLHPDVDAALEPGRTAVSIALKSGEIWVFRYRGVATLSLDPSVYLEKGRLKPRAAKQIVLLADARDYETRLGWTLAKAQDTPIAIRDLDREDLLVTL